MGLGAILEPLIVVSLLAGGTLVNRSRDGASRDYNPLHLSAFRRKKSSDSILSEHEQRGRKSEEDVAALGSWAQDAGSSTSSLTFLGEDHEPTQRLRRMKLFGWKRTVTTPNTEVFKDRFLSEVLRRFPFLVEVWYWALIYWVYQLGRAFTALTLSSSTVDVARTHALQVVHLEQSLHLFVEVPIQQYFLRHPTLMHWTNRTYSFIHIPGTILFLIVLYYLTTTRPRHQLQDAQAAGESPARWRKIMSQFRQETYRRRRRTMAMCNLFAFIVFTLWPCMPPRLLSDPDYSGPDAKEAKSFGFVDTVHGPEGESSVWTTNRFCNQYAAMPSLHFGYSFLIGLTIATFPLASSGRASWKRYAIIVAGMTYPAIILTAIVATANHFVLDAVAGAGVCGLAWRFNDVLLNLLPLEDYFLWALRIHKPGNNQVSGKNALLVEPV